ncbi:hypothetical protein D3C84_585900 [compost metagenome]
MLRLPVCVAGGVGSGFGIAGDVLDGGDHLVHRGGHLLGFHFLLGDAGTGLLGDGGHFFRRRGQLFDPATQALEQAAQAFGHLLHGLHQLAQFVLALAADVRSEVAGRHLAGLEYGQAQGHHDQLGDQQRRQQSDHEADGGGDGQHGLGFAGLGFQQVQLQVQGVGGRGGDASGAAGHVGFGAGMQLDALAQRGEFAAVALDLLARRVQVFTGGRIADLLGQGPGLAVEPIEQTGQLVGVLGLAAHDEVLLAAPRGEHVLGQFGGARGGFQ